MKRQIIPVLASVGIFLFCSCYSDLVESSSSSKMQDDNGGESVIVYERDPNLPLPKIVTNFGTLTRTTPTNRGNTDALLGYGYKTSEWNIHYRRLYNVTFPIVNLEAIRQHDPTYISGNL